MMKTKQLMMTGMLITMPLLTSCSSMTSGGEDRIKDVSNVGSLLTEQQSTLIQQAPDYAKTPIFNFYAKKTAYREALKAVDEDKTDYLLNQWAGKANKDSSLYGIYLVVKSDRLSQASLSGDIQAFHALLGLAQTNVYVHNTFKALIENNMDNAFIKQQYELALARYIDLIAQYSDGLIDTATLTERSKINYIFDLPLSQDMSGEKTKHSVETSSTSDEFDLFSSFGDWLTSLTN